MPGKKNTSKPRGAMAEAANDKNERAIAAVLDGGPGYFARVEKNLGSYFKLIYHDGAALHNDIQGEPRGIFSARGKVRVKISAGDIVLLEGIQRLPEAKARGKTLIVEIVGRLSKKEAQHLYRKSRIHKQVYLGEEDDNADDLFDYSGVEDSGASEEDEVDIQANIKRGKIIRARKMISTAEKSTGRGSGGATGRGGASGGRSAATKTAKEQLDATAYASSFSEGRADAEEEVDLEEMAEALAPKEKKEASDAAGGGPKPSVAPMARAPPTEDLDAWTEEKDVAIKSFDDWEKAADEDELDIDAI